MGQLKAHRCEEENAMAEPSKPGSVRFHASELTVQIEDENAPLVRVRVRKAAGTFIDEKSLQDALEPFAAAVTHMNRALATANVTKKDCIEIQTGDGTTIRVNCPTITLGEPTIG
jgi:hypothetical protein